MSVARFGPRRTKIVGTIGPDSASPQAIARLIDAGMDAGRLNFSHGSHGDHARYARLVREAQDAAGRPLALIGDLQGPKLRVGGLAEPLELPTDAEVVVASIRGDFDQLFHRRLDVA